MCFLWVGTGFLCIMQMSVLIQIYNVQILIDTQKCGQDINILDTHCIIRSIKEINLLWPVQ
jgi:hypothetical protein